MVWVSLGASSIFFAWRFWGRGVVISMASSSCYWPSTAFCVPSLWHRLLFVMGQVFFDFLDRTIVLTKRIFKNT